MTFELINPLSSYTVNLICYESDFYCSSPPVRLKHAGDNTVKPLKAAGYLKPRGLGTLIML